MSYPPDPYGGSPGWQGQQPGWQGQQPGWQGPQQGQGWPAQQPGWPSGQPPDNYLVWAILTTIFCCLPAGVVSIVYSSKVSGLWMQGQYAEAQAAANNAKRWAIISAIVAAVLIVGYLVFMLIMFMVGVSTYSHIPSTPTTHYYRRY
ncbi:hypothetical protein A9W99_05765 [Mycobacterium sp. 1164966.3]|uniref:CD225/dispanin family protein n=1 Tax=Mycobacterium sp. 1164966.3 TaxID=1856861 RepID=UPI0008005DF9|nr:CD225/dispanin family protein [Mycobacterium sp. 1164966.3]OBA83907.1 hypothetical protein A9W99_05765 [Mycobacterium sp. 1164966.3]